MDVQGVNLTPWEKHAVIKVLGKLIYKSYKIIIIKIDLYLAKLIYKSHKIIIIKIGDLYLAKLIYKSQNIIIIQI